MNLNPMRPPTEAERSAPKAVDLWKGMDCKTFDPEKSDHIHGRAGAAPLLFSSGRGLDTRQFCPICGRRWHWCDCSSAETERLYGTAADEQLRLTAASEASC